MAEEQKRAPLVRVKVTNHMSAPHGYYNMDAAGNARLVMVPPGESREVDIPETQVEDLEAMAKAKGRIAPKVERVGGTSEARRTVHEEARPHRTQQPSSPAGRAAQARREASRDEPPAGTHRGGGSGFSRG